MGQYQQWLHYREKEQELRAQLERLEAELTELQASALMMQEPGSYEENPLLRLLVQAAQGNCAATPVQGEQSLSCGEMAAVEDGAGARGATPEFFPWNGPLDVNMPVDRDTIPSTPLGHPEITLLPEDMASFFDEHTQTSPQLQLPWWMRRPVPASASGNTPIDQRTIPIDQESRRNNREIERWLERWRRQDSSAEQEGD